MSISRDDLVTALITGDRDVLDRIDDSILDMVEARRALVLRIAREKLSSGVPFRDPERERAMMERVGKRARGLSPAAAQGILAAVLAACRDGVPGGETE